MVEISTSILSVEKENATKVFYGLEVAHTDYFHIDVMDGKFVKNNTIDKMLDYTNTLKQMSNIPLDIHLMVEDLEKWIHEFSGFEPNIITFHIEAVKNKEEALKIINIIKKCNCKVGIAIKPNTQIEEILEFLPYIHLLLIMTVEPGYGGQELIPSTIEKIKEIKQYCKRNELEIDLQADGGINSENARILEDAGINILVIGSYITNSSNYDEKIKEIRKD